MIKRFVVDPSLVKEAVMSGHTLIVEVGEHHQKVTLGPKSPYTAFPMDIGKRPRKAA